MYTPEEKQKIEQLRTVFDEYLRHAVNAYGQPGCELIWLERLQCYMLVLNYNTTAVIQEKNLLAIPIQSAEELFAELVSSMIQDAKYYFTEPQNEQITEALWGKVEDGILEYLSTCLEVLPEYRELAINVVAGYRGFYTDNRETLKEIVM
ncbi:MAG: hypothetical protein J6J59_02670 [Peptococcaceae bacterium]|nr:hypothetical protein [Peptococcaceae bacterium]MBP3584577.1 hypothetical protein [Peptococcaceae bacterium]